MASLLYKNTGIDMTLALVGEKIDRNRFTGEKVENSTFFNCDFGVLSGNPRKFRHSV
uniref:hypothetical protein n=1 Tax=Escherichia coli TaxID=562 RepID=UPI0029C95C84|nr:hypothetical protein [Escherichia coli]WOL85199.1 hypothetical protein ICDHHECD_00007 [Escherichia coli]